MTLISPDCFGVLLILDHGQVASVSVAPSGRLVLVASVPFALEQLVVLSELELVPLFCQLAVVGAT